jgi:hypothetical protein
MESLQTTTTDNPTSRGSFWPTAPYSGWRDPRGANSGVQGVRETKSVGGLAALLEGSEGDGGIAITVFKWCRKESLGAKNQ